MAKQRFGINDAYRGTVGTVIGYQWRGRWCLRARPLRVHNPRTPRQQANRMLFKQTVSLAGKMKAALRKGLHALSLAEHITECNYFVKYNKQCFSLGADGLLAVDWEQLTVSAGELAAPLFGEGQTSLTSSTSLTSTTSLTVPFAPCAEGERASGDDEVYLWAWCPEAGEGVLSAPAWRRSGSVGLDLPERWQGKAVHLYAFAVDYHGEASPTVYLGRLEAAEPTAEDYSSTITSPTAGSAARRPGGSLATEEPSLSDLCEDKPPRRSITIVNKR